MRYLQRDGMISFQTKFCTAALVPAMLWASVFAQTPPPAQKSAAPADKSGEDSNVVFSTETRLVPLSVTVQDKSGHLMTNLPQSAFQVYENGVLQP